MQQNKIRILSAVKRKYPQFSQKQIKKMLKDKKIKINSRVAKEHDWVADKDRVKVDVAIKQEIKPNADVDCELLQLGEDYIFFYKGPGVHSVALSFDETDTAANWLLTVDEGLQSVSSPLESGLLHRLDHETSGVMVAARHKKAFEHLKQLFQKKKVYKEYQCLVSAQPPAKGLYKAYAGKKPGTAKRIHIQKGPSVAKKLTEVQTEIVSSEKLASDRYHVVTRLITGYRHQIRAHLALLGCPVVGDAVYGGTNAKRLMLHASRLEF